MSRVFVKNVYRELDAEKNIGNIDKITNSINKIPTDKH